MIELEQAILGNLILNNDLLHSCDFLTEEDFSEEFHRRLYNRLANSFKSNVPESPFTLKQFFVSSPIGISYLKQLLESVGVFFSVKDAAKSLREASLKRQLATLAADIQQTIENGEKNSHEIKELIQERIEGFHEIGKKKEPREIHDIILSVLKKAEKPRQDLMKLGFKNLDALLGGVNSGALLILAGATGMGKSAFGLNIAANIAEKKDVVLFSLEMEDEQFGSRLITNLASINSYRLKAGRLNSDENKSISDNAPKFHKLSLTIDDTAAITVSHIKHRLKRLMTKKKIGLVVIDHIHLMKPEGKHHSREREIGSISGGLKNLAREFGIPILALAQLSRASAARTIKRPILSDLRDSGSVEQDADAVMFVHRDEYYLKLEKPPEHSKQFGEWQAMLQKTMNKADIILAKNRDGNTGEVQFEFDVGFSRFTETNNF